MAFDFAQARMTNEKGKNNDRGFLLGLNPDLMEEKMARLKPGPISEATAKDEIQGILATPE